MAEAGQINRKGRHKAALCPSSALQPAFGHACDRWVVELGYLYSRYCPSCFSTPFFRSKLLFIFKIDFMLVVVGKKLHRSTTQIPKKRMLPTLTELFWWIFVPRFSGDTHFNSLHLKHFRWVLERRSIALSKKAVPRTSKLVSHPSFLLLARENLDLKKKNNVV